jgi:hypothetical protein
VLFIAHSFLLHAPFAAPARVQGDEVNYLDMAAHVLQQPLTPLNFQFVFMGRLVDAAGHPHPPLNAYMLAAAWLLRGHFSVFFFPLLLPAVRAGHQLRRLRAGGALHNAAALGSAADRGVALVQVNTNTLASPEAPALALLLIGAAAFFGEWFWMAGIALALAGLTALQALALPPILLLAYFVKRESAAGDGTELGGPGMPGPYGWIRMLPAAAWCALVAPYLALGGWQALQWALTGRLPFCRAGRLRQRTRTYRASGESRERARAARTPRRTGDAGSAGVAALVGAGARASWPDIWFRIIRGGSVCCW